MKRVTYAGESFLTADAVADALVDLTAALGRAADSEVVEMPAVDGEGVARPVRLVIGPASQLVAVPEESAFEEPDGDAVVAELEARTRAMRARFGYHTSYQSAPDYDLDELDGM
jgi:hypothetical protein